MKYRLIKILSIVILFIVALVAIYYITTPKTKVVKDSDKFLLEYKDVDKDNLFVYKTEKEIIDILKNKTGIVYFGFPECPWCQKYVVMLNEVAKEKGMEEIYYYNIKEARNSNTKEYQEIVSILGDYLPIDDAGNKKVMVPDVTFVIDGKILWHDNETATFSSGTPEEYWTENQTKVFKDRVGKEIDELFLGKCTTCN